LETSDAIVNGATASGARGSLPLKTDLTITSCIMRDNKYLDHIDLHANAPALVDGGLRRA